MHFKYLQNACPAFIHLTTEVIIPKQRGQVPAPKGLQITIYSI